MHHPISRIEIVGSERTDAQFLASVFSPCFSSTHIDNFQIPQVLQDLEKLDIFSSCKLSTTKVSNSMKSTLIFETKERRLKIYSGTDIKTSLSWIFNLELSSIFGKAEKLKLESSFGTNFSKPFEILFLKPLRPNLGHFDHVKVAYLFQRLLLNKQFVERISTISIGLFSPAQNFSIDFRIKGFSTQEKYRATPEMRKILGQFSTISFIHEKTTNFYSSTLKFRNELNKNFVKFDILALSQLDFLQRLFLSTRFRIGILAGSSPALDDQLQIGGPFSVRGFDRGQILLGMKPNSANCFFAIESGVTLGYRIANLLSCHLFFDSGALSESYTNKSLLYSFGAGVSIKINPQSRVEINIAFPVEGGRFKQVSTQIGIGTELM